MIGIQVERVTHLNDELELIQRSIQFEFKGKRTKELNFKRRTFSF